MCIDRIVLVVVLDTFVSILRREIFMPPPEGRYFISRQERLGVPTCTGRK